MTIWGLLASFTSLISKTVIPLFFALAVVMLVWGIVNYFIINAADESKRNQGKQLIIWGMVALVVMTSVWGLVNILGNTFGVSTSVLPQVRPNGSPLKPNNGPGTPVKPTPTSTTPTQSPNACSVCNTNPNDLICRDPICSGD